MNPKDQITQALAQSGPVSDELIQLMFQHIGDLDPDLRDETIYLGWLKLLMEKRWTTAQKQWLLTEISHQDLLFKDIEEVGDSVFTRSFTSLLLVLLIGDNAEEEWLTPIQEQTIIQTSLAYMRQEKDNRGLVAEKGWAHAFAHGADLLGALAQLNSLTAANVSDILNCLSRALLDIDDFLYGEESRMAIAVMELIKGNKLTEDVLQSWIHKENQRLMRGNSFNLCWSKFLLALPKILQLENIPMPTIGATADEFFKWNYQTFQVI